MTSSHETSVFPEHMPDIPLDDLPVPLVPGGFWDPEDQHPPTIEPELPDYESMVRNALIACLAVLASKVGWIVVVANVQGILVSVRLWGGFLPYLGMDVTDVATAGNNTFATIVTVSTIGMGFTAVLLMAWPMIRPGLPRLDVLGRSVAIAVVLETWIFEVFREVFDRTTLIMRWDLAWITLVELLLAAALLFLTLKQPRSVADITERSTDALPHDPQVILEDTP
ncbi:MAG: hypothetical protein QNJ88_06885 [Acidimicrobiia bacterium]|nr:hypothetical protein [Acidimicrobiia bacterium]